MRGFSSLVMGNRLPLHRPRLRCRADNPDLGSSAALSFGLPALKPLGELADAEPVNAPEWQHTPF